MAASLHLPRSWTWPGVFSLEQHEVRGDDWAVMRLTQAGARSLQWRPAAAGWSALWFVASGEAWASCLPMPRGSWEPIVFGRPCVTSHQGEVWMVAARRPLLVEPFARLDPTDAVGLEAVLRLASSGAATPVDDDTRSLATAIASLTSRLETSPTSMELSDALELDDRRTSEAAARYFSRFHATVGGWREYLRALRLELALSAFSADRSTKDVARWLGFRNATALLHSMKKEGLPAPGALRAAERDPAPGTVLSQLLTR
jgi:AraC-like DNA-binding protein